MANTDVRASGINGAIVLGGPVNAGGTLVVAKTQFTFSNQRDFFDGSAFSDTNKRWFPGLRDAQGTWAGLLDLSGDLLVQAASLGARLLYLYNDSGQGASSITPGTPFEAAHGSGFLDSTIDISLNDMCKASGAFRASANWVIS